MVVERTSRTLAKSFGSSKSSNPNTPLIMLTTVSFVLVRYSSTVRREKTRLLEQLTVANWRITSIYCQLVRAACVTPGTKTQEEVMHAGQ